MLLGENVLFLISTIGLHKDEVSTSKNNWEIISDVTNLEKGKQSNR